MHELCHYNIPGSHWGIRRFQNKDGTLTPAGKERYRKINAALKPGKDGKPSLAEKTARNAQNMVETADSLVVSNRKGNEKARREAQTLSDEELRRRISRLQMEKQYADLSSSNELSAGRARAHEILRTTGEMMGIATGAVSIAAAIYQIKKS